MANTLYYSAQLKDTVVNAWDGSHVDFDSNGFATVDDTDTDLVNAVVEQGAVKCFEAQGATESVTADSATTATVIYGLYINAGDGSGTDLTVTLKETDTNGAQPAGGPFVIPDDTAGLLLFPGGVTFTGGLFLEDTAGTYTSGVAFIAP